MLIGKSLLKLNMVYIYIILSSYFKTVLVLTGNISFPSITVNYGIASSSRLQTI